MGDGSLAVATGSMLTTVEDLRHSEPSQMKKLPPTVGQCSTLVMRSLCLSWENPPRSTSLPSTTYLLRLRSLGSRTYSLRSRSNGWRVPLWVVTMKQPVAAHGWSSTPFAALNPHMSSMMYAATDRLVRTAQRGPAAGRWQRQLRTAAACTDGLLPRLQRRDASQTSAVGATLTAVSKIPVNVSNDHVRRLTKRPVAAIAELVWNALDADATDIAVEIERNELHGVARVSVVDNGEGMSPERARHTLTRLGGSWKAVTATTTAGRRLHGAQGRGRFAVLSFAARATWTSVWRDVDGTLWRTTAVIDCDDAANVELESIKDTAPDSRSGTTVVVAAASGAAPELLRPDATDELTGLLALHLEQYPELRVSVDGIRLDTAILKLDHREYDIEVPTQAIAEGEDAQATLVILEWARTFPRALVLCDRAGSAIFSVDAGIHARGFNFTAYLRWEGFRRRGHDIALPEADTPVAELVASARAQLKQHFKERSAERRAAVLDQWRSEGAYPYKEPAVTQLEAAERQIFDVVAIAAEPVLRTGDTAGRRLSLALIRTALQTSPQALTEVLTHVLQLSKEQLRDLESLLQRTSLASVVAAAKTITDRLEFLAALPTLLFDEDVAAEVLETRHLHRILVEHTWLFGEAYALMADDEGLTTVLRRHLQLLGRDEPVQEPVVGPDGRRTRVDLLLGRVMLDAHGRREHVVIELKRPTTTASKLEYDQIIGYADAVAGDARFAGDEVKWQFWLIARDVDEYVQRRMTQPDRQRGLVEKGAGYEVWVKTWAQILGDAERRMAFMQNALQYEASGEAGLQYLQATYDKYLPDVARSTQPAA